MRFRGETRSRPDTHDPSNRNGKRKMSISQLINDLNSDQLAVRRRAAEQLAAAPDAAAAVSLVRACGDADEQVREWAVAALEQLGPPDAADGPAILNLLTNANRDVRYWSATLLGRLGRLAPRRSGRWVKPSKTIRTPQCVSEPPGAGRNRSPSAVGSASPGTGGPGRRSPLGAVGPAIAGKDPGRLILAARTGFRTPDSWNSSPSRNRGKICCRAKNAAFFPRGRPQHRAQRCYSVRLPEIRSPLCRGYFLVGEDSRMLVSSLD